MTGGLLTNASLFIARKNFKPLHCVNDHIQSVRNEHERGSGTNCWWDRLVEQATTGLEWALMQTDTRVQKLSTHEESICCVLTPRAVLGIIERGVYG
eukprot:8134927-Pyramimonas_sp.AAC.1